MIAALLTLIGYSMNDKIVIFDRVRENLKVARRESLKQLVNTSINQTLSRTVLTAGPTLLCTLALYFLGGPVLNGIAYALFIGIVVGTYSSDFRSQLNSDLLGELPGEAQAGGPCRGGRGQGQGIAQ